MADPKTPSKKRCFVVGPIGKDRSEVRDHADWLFYGIVRPVFEGRDELKDFLVERADGIQVPGMIDTQVIGHLLDDELVIADLSRTNPNAFYEIGIRHMVEKPIIHMHEDGGEIPFDVSLYRSIPFSRRTPATLREAQEALGGMISAVLAPGYKCDNPIIRARGRIKVEQSASPEQKVLLNEVRSLRNEVQKLKNSRGVSRQQLLSGETVEFELTIGEDAVAIDVDRGIWEVLQKFPLTNKELLYSSEGARLRVFGPDLSLRDYVRLGSEIEQLEGVISAEIISFNSEMIGTSYARLL